MLEFNIGSSSLFRNGTLITLMRHLFQLVGFKVGNIKCEGPLSIVKRMDLDIFFLYFTEFKLIHQLWTLSNGKFQFFEIFGETYQIKGKLING